MPNMKAAEKALRQTKKRTAKNALAISEIGKLKSAIKHAVEAKETKKAKEIFVALQARVDKGIKNNLFKKSSGARIKSRVNAMIAKSGK